jgi:protein involved in polysaccharide export with SLBB domain
MNKVLLASLLIIGGTVSAVHPQKKPSINNNHASVSAGAAASTATRQRILAREEAIASTTPEILKATRPYRISAASPTANTSSAQPPARQLSMARANVSAASNSASASVLTQVYRVGVGDVLDIQIQGNPTKHSTLFTVLEGGVVDYPLVGTPVAVQGLTTSEVANRLKQKIKYFNGAAVTVKVRDFASHNVTVAGFVASPGSKILRREAVPLYVVLSEAVPLPEANQATILRSGQNPVVVALSDHSSSSTLVVPGDYIRVSAESTPTEFFFAGGGVSSPGQKTYHAGLTLTQAILASGGLSKQAGSVVRISRRGTDGRLISSEYNLLSIHQGHDPDPLVSKGDRIEVKLR